MLDGEKNNLDSLTENVHGQLGQAPWRQAWKLKKKPSKKVPARLQMIKSNSLRLYIHDTSDNYKILLYNN